MKGQPSSQNFFNSKTMRDAIDKATSPLQKIIDEAIEMYLLAIDKVKTRLPYRAPKVQTIY